jgi:hypothetical protein
MDNTTSEEAAREQLQQPLQDLDRAAQPEQLNREESTQEAAVLQQKMIMAAMKFVELDAALWEQEPATNESYAEMCCRAWTPLVHCTPGKPSTVFFRLGNQWVKLTQENVTEALKSLVPGLYDAEGIAEDLLNGIRDLCKDLKKVNWVLPKLDGGLA